MPFSRSRQSRPQTAKPFTNTSVSQLDVNRAPSRSSSVRSST